MSEAPQPEGSGDRPTQFVRLLKRHERRLSAYVMSLVPNWADADEIVQEVCVRLWTQFAEYDPESDFGAWACTIAHYQVLTYRKRKGLDAQFSERFAQTVRAGLETAAADADRRHSALADCLQQLAPHLRDVIIRYYGGAATIEQTAAEQGRTPSAIYKMLAKSRSLLRDCVDRTLRQEETL